MKRKGKRRRGTRGRGRMRVEGHMIVSEDEGNTREDNQMTAERMRGNRCE